MDQMLKERIETNYTVIKENVELAKKDNNIDYHIEIAAITKYVSSQYIKVLFDLGITTIGESRIKDAHEKFNELKKAYPGCLDKIKKHFVGHLQSNKAKDAVRLFDCILSVDSFKIANRIAIHGAEEEKVVDVMIQVNIGKEPQKYGIMPEKVVSFYDEIKDLENINIIGLMCIAPKISEAIDENKLKYYFLEMKRLKEKLNLKELSMGMSADYELAIDCGSTHLRIGSSFFN